MIVRKIVLVCCFFGVMAASVRAQDYQQIRQAILEQQRQTRSQIDELNDLITHYESRLHSTNEKYETIYERYQNLKRSLALQKNKIASLREERDQINREITVTRRKIEEQQDKLDRLIANYKKSLRYLYKNGQVSQLALILSSASINQMMVRNYYLKKFEAYRQKQVAEIKQTKKELEESKQQLDGAAAHNKKVLAEIEVEKRKLQQKTDEQQDNVKLLRKDKEQIKEKLTDKKQQKEDLNNTLSGLIAREEKIRKEEEARRKKLAAQKNNAKSAGAAKKKSTPAPAENESEAANAERAGYVGTVGYVSDAKLKKIEASFAKLKGSLPWPVKSQTVSEHFGRHRNPVYGTVTPNLGIEIVTKPRQEVHVVHGGYVFAVQPITGYGDVVFVSHGKYKTAYGNLSRVLVRKNTILKKGDLVGYAGDKNSTRGASVFFMLRSGSQNLDPEDWLK